jgi:antitoxin (DNA-binding transcriptional repressor) of toxin-antitoxin stability system
MTEHEPGVRISNAELATVREAMRELHRLLAALDDGEVEKIVLTQRNQMLAVLITLERYTELQQNAAQPAAPATAGHE